VITLEAAFWDSEITREGVKFFDRGVTDQMAPESIVRRPDCSVDQNRHQLLNPVRNRCSASSSTAGCLQKAQRT